MFSTFMVIVNNINNAITNFRIVPSQLPQRIAHVHEQSLPLPMSLASPLQETHG